MSLSDVLPALLEQRRHQRRFSFTKRSWFLLLPVLGLSLSTLGLVASLSLWKDGVRPSTLKLIFLAYGFLAFGGVMVALVIWFFRARARIVPYFARELGSYPGETSVAFGRGHDLYRSSAELERVAATRGVRPLSAFGFADDLYGQTVRWWPASDGLRTAEALREMVPAGSGIAGDLDALAAVLRLAAGQGVEFALVLRLGGGDLQSAAVFEPRERIGRFW